MIIYLASEFLNEDINIKIDEGQLFDIVADDTYEDEEIS